MTTPTLTIFFDGGCPMCSKEIAHYRKLDGADRLIWLDVTDASVDVERYGIDRIAAMQTFHVLDDAGSLQLGADGFLALWDALPGYRWLARICRGLRLPGLMRWLYRHFAQWHFRRRCADGDCATDHSP